jgi:hypothetical protein
MIRLRTMAVLGLIALSLAGCGSVGNLLGTGVDDTVLPGAREDAIPGRSQFPEAGDPSTLQPAGTAGAPPPASPAEPVTTACDPADPACQPPSGDDTFSDPQ